jgi:DNA topoisomerase-2
MRGVYEIQNTTTVNITELPPSMTFQKYETHLNSLQDRGIIYSYEDNSTDGINYTIKFARATLSDLIAKGKLDQTLKMIETETENLTCLNEKGKLIIFEDVSQVVEYFVNFRLGFYSKRKAFLIKKYGEELVYLSNRAKFVKLIIDGKLKINNVPRKEIISYLQTAGFDEVNGSYNYLLNMPIHSLTKETYDQLLNEVSEKKAELAEIKKKEPIDMYREDLVELKKNLKTTLK